MRKQSSKILVLGVVCLAFLFMLSSLFGCNFTFLKGEPEFKTIQLQYDGKYYPFKIPGFMPDFTQFPDSPQVDYYSVGMLASLTYFVPDSPINAQGLPDQYFFLVSNIPANVPTVLGIGILIGDNYRYWLYKEGLPIEATKEATESWIDAWIQMKLQEAMGEDREEIKPI